jgi:hypothetical protein
MKLKDITPKKFSCGIGACPAIFKTAEGRYVVIGKRLPADASPDLAGRIAPGEAAVEIPAGLMRALRQPKAR